MTLALEGSRFGISMTALQTGQAGSLLWFGTASHCGKGVGVVGRINRAHGIVSEGPTCGRTRWPAVARQSMESKGKSKAEDGLLGRRAARLWLGFEAVTVQKREEGAGGFINGAYLVKTSPAAKFKERRCKRKGVSKYFCATKS